MYRLPLEPIPQGCPPCPPCPSCPPPVVCRPCPPSIVSPTKAQPEVQLTYVEYLGPGTSDVEVSWILSGYADPNATYLLELTTDLLTERSEISARDTKYIYKFRSNARPILSVHLDRAGRTGAKFSKISLIDAQLRQANLNNKPAMARIRIQQPNMPTRYSNDVPVSRVRLNSINRKQSSGVFTANISMSTQVYLNNVITFNIQTFNQESSIINNLPVTVNSVVNTSNGISSITIVSPANLSAIPAKCRVFMSFRPSVQSANPLISTPQDSNSNYLSPQIVN